MPNRNFDDLKNGNSATNAIITAVGLIIAGLSAAGLNRYKNNKEAEQLEHKNQTMRDEPFGKYRHRDEIERNNREIERKRGFKK